MSREKQIVEEMKKDLCECHTIDEWAAREYGEAYTDFDATAQKLYAKGWSKQSEGEWVQMKARIDWFDINGVRCSVCGSTWAKVYVRDFKFCPNCGAKMRGESK